MLMSFLVLVLSIYIYANSLYYTICLLVISIFTLFSLSTSYSIRVFLFLLLVIVYAGAMMILIGYICAICPNPSFQSYSGYFFILTLFLPLLFLSLDSLLAYSYSSISVHLGDFFYSLFGLYFFSLLILMLFLTLLIVTSQYLSPKGPLRSSNL